MILRHTAQPIQLKIHSSLACQYDSRELGEGLIQASRRVEYQYISAWFPLCGLEPDATYEGG